MFQIKFSLPLHLGIGHLLLFPFKQTSDLYMTRTLLCDYQLSVKYMYSVMHDSDSGIGIDSGIIALLTGIGIGIGIKHLEDSWNRIRNQRF